MRNLVIIIILFFSINSSAQQWEGKWISCEASQNITNTWLAFRKNLVIEKVPSVAVAKIAVDSKYWLWINGRLAVFEGGLKRGPTPKDTYYDDIDIAPYLQIGQNTIAVQVCYFGKEGFSHKSSGRIGLLFDCQAEGISILSDKDWQCGVLKAYQTAGNPLPNFRLPESNILFDARLSIDHWTTDLKIKLPPCIVLGHAGDSPWNGLILRPIPLWKNSGIKEYTRQYLKSAELNDTAFCQLPYNAQITPYLKIDASEAGKKIIICTDNYLTFNGGTSNIRAEYITRQGIQEYESLGWQNGHKVIYIIPKGIKIISLEYRETGYDTELSGSFRCNDPFFNQYWIKAQRTLYLNMRDTYFDCPDRERAQWTGDAVTETNQAFYALSPSSHLLSKKWLHELAGWQRKDSTMYAPVPSGNWNNELPDQVLTTVGYFGIWNYYMHTGDKKTLSEVYPAIKKYLGIWQQTEWGTIKFRSGGWAWGDWGEEKDMLALFNLWFFLAEKGMYHAALALDKKEDAAEYKGKMLTFKDAFNKQFWTGTAYRSPEYKGRTDDRVQALAALSGIADSAKYPNIFNVLRNEEHASPYMEKYVMEALFKMNQPEYALQRAKKRFYNMVEDKRFSTLWEGWSVGDKNEGGGSINHAWSGGGLAVLSGYLCGVSPLTPGYKSILILPQPGDIRIASTVLSSVAGTIKLSLINNKKYFIIKSTIPKKTSAIIGIPKKYKKIWLNGKLIEYKDEDLNHQVNDSLRAKYMNYNLFKVSAGNWTLSAKK